MRVSKVKFVLLVFILFQVMSCADVPVFVPANPCDPDYTGDEVCPSDVVDTGVHLDTGQWNDVGTFDGGHDAGEGDSGADCECDTVSACCDGCHPIAVGEICDDDGLACTEQRCSSVGSCELILVDGWCLKDDACHNTLTDPFHCGSCGNECRRVEVCFDGSCVDDCPSGYTDCDGGCFDTTADLLNCGSCGNGCNTGEECSDGACITPCPSGLSDCSGTCVDLSSNPLHCGTCDTECSRSKVCAGGECVDSCPSGHIDCEGACVLLESNRFHCGQCGNACRDNQVCVDGDCVIPCDEGLTDCGGACVSLPDDEAHCGACNHACSQGASCVAGECITAVTGVSVSPTTLNLGAGETVTLTATVRPANATDKSVVWTSSRPSVAAVDDDGNVTAVGAGSAIITVTTVDGGFTASCEVTVVVRVTGVTVEPSELSLMPGEQANLQVVIAPADATNKAVTWSSSDLNVATVDNTGNVEAVSPGTATITATTADGNKQAHCEVTVGATAVTGITITPPTITIVKGQGIQLQADITPEDATDKRVQWTSSDENIVAVNSGGVITGIAGGQAIVTATTLSGNQTDTCAVTVQIPVTGITVAPESLVIPPGGTGQLTATITPEDATNKAVTWTSSNPSVASVNASGLVTGESMGTATITATTNDGGYTDTATVQVGIPVTSVNITPESVAVMINKTSQLTVTVSPANATNKSVTWSSSANAVATVNSTGLVTGVSTGTSIITVTTVDGNRTATATVTTVDIPEGFVRINAGSFTMGSPSGELGRYPSETQHQVTLTRSFLMKTTEVTQGEWKSRMGNINSSSFQSCGDNCPMEQVTWFSALAYANAVSAAEGLPSCYNITDCTSGTANDGTWSGCTVTVTGTGGNPYNCTGYRLPTEAEWEYAARAGSTTAFHTGDITGEQTCSNMNAAGWYYYNSGNTTHTVGGKAANAWGLEDMHGNVHEWTWDWYTADITTFTTDPTGATTGSYRVVRGGSCYDFACNCRAAIRNYRAPGSRHYIFGFRLARSI